MLKIAIFGGTGLLGSNLMKLYDSYDCRAFSRKSSINIEDDSNFIIDFSKLEESLRTIFEHWQPDIIINTVALVNLQKCEDDYPLAFEANVSIAYQLAEIAKKYGSYFIHVSTDHYYHDSQLKHNEMAAIVLKNNYAKSKREAELVVKKAYNQSLIVRTNIIGFRKNGKDSFFEWLLKSLQKQDEISMYNNFYTSPISVKQLGEILIQCYYKQLRGIYNIAACDVINKYDFAIKTAEIFQLSAQNIKAIKLINNKKQVRRALTLGLDCKKISKDLNLAMPTIDETLKYLYNEYTQQHE